LIELPVEASIDTDAGKVYQKIPAYKAIIRDDGHQMAVLRDTYKVVQPQELIEQFAPYFDSGLVEPIAGGSLKNGSRISVIGKIKGSDREIAPGEQIGAFLNFYAGLDGSLGIGGKVFGVQVRCLNGMCSSETRFSMVFKHTKNVMNRLSDIKTDIAKAIQAFDRDAEVYAELATKKVTRQQMVAYVHNVILTDEERAVLDAGEELSTKRVNTLDTVIDLLDTQRGLELVPAVRGTAFQAYSAITEHLTYNQGRTPDSRLNAQLFGDSARMNREALNLARVM
jgi:phage/plasmid-like protein (TIGR03299 family)